MRYPVAIDDNYGTWNAYNNEYWPAEYLIDAQGRIRLADFGEGNYSAKERAIRSLLVEAGASGLGAATHVRAQQPSEAETTPESYLGAEKAQRFENPQIVKGTHDYGQAGTPPQREHLRYGGAWTLSESAATAGTGASLQLSFLARRVFLVMGVSPTRVPPTRVPPTRSPRGERSVRVLLDGRPIPQRLSGTDVKGSTVSVGFQRLYRLVELPGVQRHVLTVVPQPGVSVYSFTFG